MAVGNDASAPLVHSISYGDIEADDDFSVDNRFDQEIQELGARGLTVFVASGDDGVANFIARTNASACGFNPSFPATSPHVTAVGATQGPESGNPEIACTSQTGGGITTGGGFSVNFAQPSYQTDAVNTYTTTTTLPPLNLFNSNGRGYPDVAVLGFNCKTLLFCFFPIIILSLFHLQTHHTKRRYLRWWSRIRWFRNISFLPSVCCDHHPRQRCSYQPRQVSRGLLEPNLVQLGKEQPQRVP
jgi:hypothetical protein